MSSFNCLFPSCELEPLCHNLNNLNANYTLILKKWMKKTKRLKVNVSYKFKYLIFNGKYYYCIVLTNKVEYSSNVSGSFSLLLLYMLLV